MGLLFWFSIVTHMVLKKGEVVVVKSVLNFVWNSILVCVPLWKLGHRPSSINVIVVLVYVIPLLSMCPYRLSRKGLVVLMPFESMLYSVIVSDILHCLIRASYFKHCNCFLPLMVVLVEGVIIVCPSVCSGFPNLHSLWCCWSR
jgi:hypothetical protein